MSYNLIEKYGVRLIRLTHDKIELVRRWRNDPKISQYMEYRDEITPEMQEAWFQRTNNENNFYHIIEINGKEVGLIDIRDIDYVKGEGEPGIFVWDDEYINSPEIFNASFANLDFAFETLGLKRLIIHVLKDNPRAIKYNKAIGYLLSPNQENVYNQEYTLVYPIYKSKRDRLLKYL